MQTREVNRQSTSTWLDRLKTLLPILLLAYIPIKGILILARLQDRVPISSLTRDPLATLNKPFYIGILSNLGILFWCSAAAICFFSYAVLRSEDEQNVQKSFLLFSGVVTSVLLIDDFFLLHEEVFPKYLGIPEEIAYLGYGVMISLYLIGFRKVIRRTEFTPLLLAIGWFGLSVLIDGGIVPVSDFLELEDEVLLEDGTKLLGVVSWFVYFAMVCRKQVNRAMVQQIERSY